jgi:hypothetical protein
MDAAGPGVDQTAASEGKQQATGSYEVSVETLEQ